MAWCRVNAVSDVLDFVEERIMRLILFWKLFSWDQGRLSKLGLTKKPLLPSLTRIHNEVFLEPFLVLAPLLFEEDATVFDRLSVLLQVEEKQIHVEFFSVHPIRIGFMVFAARSVENFSLFCCAGHAIVLIKIVSSLVLHSDHGDVKAIQSFVVLSIFIGSLSKQ